MAIKLWSKLENDGDVTSPQLGTGGAVGGSPTYVAGRFNNGIYCDVNGEYATFPTAANSINLDKGTIEFWLKPDYDQTYGVNPYLWTFNDFSNGGVRAGFNAGENDFYVGVYSGGSPVFTIYTAGLTWNVGDLIHIAVTWDRTGADIGSSKTIAMYINNSEEVSSTTTWGADTVLADLYINNFSNGNVPGLAVFDNLKCYDTCKTDFSDKDTEGIDVAYKPQMIMIQSLIMLPSLAEILKFAGGC